MSDLVIYLSMVVVGYLAGGVFRRAGKGAPWLSATLTCVVMLLVFTMGLRIGANEEVVSNLDFIGLYALVFTVAVLLLTGIALHFMRIGLGIDRHGMVRGKSRPVEGQDDDVLVLHGNASIPTQLEPAGSGSIEGAAKEASCQAGMASESGAAKSPSLSAVDAQPLIPRTDGPAPRGVDKMTLRMLGSVVVGLLCGVANLHFGWISFGSLDVAAGRAIRLLLCALLVFIGLELGIEGKVLQNIREAGARILSVPATVIVATFTASALCSLFLPISLKESLAIGAGFGWYSLAPSIIMDQGYMTAGAISFLHNILRELLSILIVPTVARHVGYIECTGLGGATSMDVGLPVVEQSTNGITAVYAFVSGAVLSLLVPVLVPLILAL